MSDHEITPAPDDPNALDTSTADVAPSPIPSAGPKIAIALGMAVLVAGAAVVFALRSSAGGTLEEHVPADAVLFARVSLRAPAEQRAGIDSLLSRLSEDQRSAVSTGLDSTLDEILDVAGVSWSGDVKGWIGHEVGLAIAEFDAAAILNGPPIVAMLSVRDEDAARATLTQARDLAADGAFVVQDGIAYIAPLRSTIVSLIEGASGSSLADDPDYVAARDEFGGGLAFMWADGRELAPALGAVTGGASLGSGAFALGLSVEANAIVVEGRSFGGTDGASGSNEPIVGSTAADQLGSLTLFDLGSALEAIIGFADSAAAFGEEIDVSEALAPFDALGIDAVDDVVPWMRGEATLLVAGFTGPVPDVGVVFEVTDEAALERTLAGLERNARTLGELLGVPLRARTIDGHLALEVDGFALFTRRGNGRFAIATRPLLAEDLLVDAAQPLRDDPVYQRAVGASSGALTFQAFVRLDIIGTLATAFLSAEDRAAIDDFGAVLLSEAESFIIRTTSAEDGGGFRMALTFAE